MTLANQAYWNGPTRTHDAQPIVLGARLQVIIAMTTIKNNLIGPRCSFTASPPARVVVVCRRPLKSA